MILNLKNDQLIVEVSTLGAEVVKIADVASGKDYLFQADPKFWKRSSPVLFPIVGRVREDKYFVDGAEFSLPPHGFARDTEFEPLYAYSNRLDFSLKYNEDTLKLYPFKFELIISYVLKERSLSVLWTVKNLDEKQMYFSIGAHPAFNLDLNAQNDYDNYSLTFDKAPLEAIEFIEAISHVTSKKLPLSKQKEIPLNKKLIDDYKVIITENIDSVTLNKDGKPFVGIDCKDFPVIGFWTANLKGDYAPFICLEPWHGIADNIDNPSRELKDKEQIISLAPKSEFNTSYTIKIY